MSIPEKTTHRIPLLCLLMTLLAAPCRADTDTIEVGALVSLSGNWAAIGENIQRGLKLAADEVNRNGAAHGRQLRINFQDTDEEKSGAKAVSAYQHLRSRGVKFFIGPVGVPGLMALIPLALKDDVILIGPTATNSFYKQSQRFFNASGDNYVTTKATAEHAFKRGFRRMAVFGSLQPWEQQQAETFRQEFVKLGGTIVLEVSPAPDQADLRIEALKIINRRPDAVFFAIFNQIAPAAKALHELGFAGGKLLAHTDSDHLTGSAGGLEQAELFLFNPPSSAFVKKFKDRYGTDPGLFADSAYDALISLAAGLNRAKDSNPVAVAAAMHGIKFEGSSGKSVGYDRDGLISRDIRLHHVVGLGVYP